MKSYQLTADYAFLIGLDSTATSDPGEWGRGKADYRCEVSQVRLGSNETYEFMSLWSMSLSTHMTEKLCFEQQNYQYLMYRVDVFPNRRIVLTGRWRTVLAQLQRTTVVWRLTPRRWVWALKQWPMRATPHLATRFSQCYTAPKHKVFSI